MEKIKYFIKKNQNNFMIVFVTMFFLLLTAPTLFSNKHFLYNLEPYPDGLYYTLSAKKFSETGNLLLEYNGISSFISQPPTYAFILSFGYLIWNNPASFYIMNIIFVLFALLFLTKIIIQNTNTFFIRILAVAFLLTHGYIYWIVSLPMTENATLLFFSASLYFITKKSFSKKDFFITTFISILLILTRLSIVPTAAVFIILGFIRYKKNKSLKIQWQHALILICSILIINYLFDKLIGNSLINYAVFFIKELLSPNSKSFYNISFISQNFTNYIKIILGNKSNFLWLQHPLTNFSFLGAIIYNIFLNKNKKKLFKKIQPLLLILCSLFILLLPFYVTDSRYILYLIPLLTSLFVITIPKKTNLHYKIILSLLYLILTFSQFPLFKTIVSDNILHRSRAWQYEATQVIDLFAKDKSNFKIITALPPHLVDAYSKNDMKIYPLSTSQEFLQKKQYVWGTDIEYDNLIEYYKTELKSDNEIYITNSYITHQQSVINDYEEFKNNFNLILVKEECLNSCNIYKLEIKE